MLDKINTNKLLRGHVISRNLRYAPYHTLCFTMTLQEDFASPWDKRGDVFEFCLVSVLCLPGFDCPHAPTTSHEKHVAVQHPPILAKDTHSVRFTLTRTA